MKEPGKDLKVQSIGYRYNWEEVETKWKSHNYAKLKDNGKTIIKQI